MADISEDEAPTGLTPMDLLLFLQGQADAWLRGRNVTGFSYAVFVTDGGKPGAGTVVSVRAGRYADAGEADVLNPDEQAAYEERTRIRDAIVEHLGDVSQEGIDVEALTDDIVAAQAGE